MCTEIQTQRPKARPNILAFGAEVSNSRALIVCSGSGLSLVLAEWEKGYDGILGCSADTFSGISRSYLDVSPSVRMVLDIRLKVFGAFGIVVAFGCATLVLVEA